MSNDSLRELPNRRIYDVFVGGEGLSHNQKRWIKIGVAFLNRDQSIHVVLDALPLNGKLYLRERRVPLADVGDGPSL